MATNGLSIANSNCDIEIYNNTDQYGYKLMQPIVETRGSNFVGQVASGSPTDKTAAPFTIATWERFTAGYGQLQQNRIFGGVGEGGNNESFIASDGYTLSGNVLMPGMARNLLPNATDPLGEKISFPRGVLWSKHPSGATTKFNVAAPITFTQRIRVLVDLDQLTTATVTAKLYDSGFTLLHTYTGTALNTNGWQGFAWARLDGSSTVALTAGNYYLKVEAGDYAIGCFVGTLDAASDVLQPYVQGIQNTSAPYRSYADWSGIARKFETVKDAGVYKTVGLADAVLYNPEIPANGQYSYTPTNPYYRGSIVFDNQLYVGVSGTANQGTFQFTATEAAKGGTASVANTLTGVVMGSAIEHDSKIFFVDIADKAIKKWDGNFPATVTTIINPDKLPGSKNDNNQNPVNALFISRGVFYVFKPEGVFMLYGDVSRIANTDTPKWMKIIDYDSNKYAQNGKWVVELNGSIYFNCRHMIYQLNVSDRGNEVKILVPRRDIDRFNPYNYVNGLTTDGQNIIAGFNNIGIMAYNGIGWHELTDYYLLSTVPSNDPNQNDGSALKYVISPDYRNDYLFVADAAQIVKMPFPAKTERISLNVTQRDQNKTLFWLSSFWDADLSRITKNLLRVFLRAFPKGWKFKVIGAMYVTGEPNFRTIAKQTLMEGLTRDVWRSPTTPAATNYPAVSTKVLDTGTGLPTATDAPAYFIATEFNNSEVTATKDTTPDHVNKPVKTTQVAFAIFGWQPTGDQHNSSYDLTDPTYIDAFGVEFLPIQNYVGVYSVVLDLTSFQKGETAAQRTKVQSNNSLAFLRAVAGSKTPYLFKFKNMEGISNTKIVKGFIQNLNVQTDPFKTAKGDSLPKIASFTILSIEEEYTSS